MTFFEILAAISSVYLTGVFATATIYTALLVHAVSHGHLKEKSGKELTFSVLLTAVVWPLFIAFVINKFTKPDA